MHIAFRGFAEGVPFSKTRGIGPTLVGARRERSRIGASGERVLPRLQADQIWSTGQLWIAQHLPIRL